MNELCRARILFNALIASCVAAAPSAHADEGKWTPKQAATLNRKGLELSPTRLWDEKRGTGLLAAAVNVNGCSGAFVSAEGLVVTNHHCIFSMLQEHATPARDLTDDGYLARTRAEELYAKAARIQVPRRFVDVTRQVLGAVPPGADDLARFVAIDAKQKELVRACEAKPSVRCHVAAFAGGLEYTLVEAMEIQDVRLVYAPPLGVGDFGGEIDNWTWPRHSGDFGIVRAYVARDGSPAPFSPDNVPFKAEFFFPLSKDGVKPGDFVMALGYPSVTMRELLAEEMAFRATRALPKIVATYSEMVEILERVSDSEGKIAVAAQLNSLYNRKKNAAGQLQGLARGKIVEKARAAEAAVVAYCEKSCVDALESRRSLLAELQANAASFDREFLLDSVPRFSRALYVAATLARLSTERAKPDLQRDPAFMEREVPRLRERLEREQKNIFVPADKKMFAAWLGWVLALAPDQRISGFDPGMAKNIDALYASTRILGLESRMALFGKTPAQLHAEKDPLLELGFAIAAELDRLKTLNDRRQGAASRLRPLWRRAVLDHAKTPIAPDANGTLRVTFGEVKGYSPKDGVLYTPLTTLGGMLAKTTGTKPFAIPDRLARAIRPGDHSLPVCFLADLDTASGNSGSPVVDGRGRLVGVNFDRVWENVANDFGYDPGVARNISADVRYLVWILDRVENARALLVELGVGGG